jgi:hypothetical protein
MSNLAFSKDRDDFDTSLNEGGAEIEGISVHHHLGSVNSDEHSMHDIKK